MEKEEEESSLTRLTLTSPPPLRKRGEGGWRVTYHAVKLKRKATKGGMRRMRKKRRGGLIKGHLRKHKYPFKQASLQLFFLRSFFSRAAVKILKKVEDRD